MARALSFGFSWARGGNQPLGLRYEPALFGDIAGQLGRAFAKNPFESVPEIGELPVPIGGDRVLVKCAFGEAPADRLQLRGQQARGVVGEPRGGAARVGDPGEQAVLDGGGGQGLLQDPHSLFLGQGGHPGVEVASPDHAAPVGETRVLGPGQLQHQVVSGVGAQAGDPVELGNVEIETHVLELEDGSRG